MEELQNFVGKEALKLFPGLLNAIFECLGRFFVHFYNIFCSFLLLRIIEILLFVIEQKFVVALWI